MRTVAMIMDIIIITVMRINIKLLLCVLAVAASSSCSKEQVGDPYILFEVHGKVTDADGNPIPGIKVLSGVTDAQETNSNGNFTFFGRSVPSASVILTFEDKDGDKNGGEFVTMSQEVSLIMKTSGSATGNFKGTYYADQVTVVMLAKKLDKTDTDSGLIPLSSTDTIPEEEQ